MPLMDAVLRGLDATTVITFFVVFLICYYWMTTPSNLPPGPPGLPVVGNLLSFLQNRSDLIGLLKKCRQKYGDIFTVRLGSNYAIVVSNCEMMHSLFVKQGRAFSGRPNHLYTSQRITAAGVGVILGTGPTWKALRHLTLRTLKDLGVGKKSLEQRVQEEARAVVDVIEAGQGHPLSVRPLMSKLSANIICNIVFGNRFDYNDSTFIKLTEIIGRLAERQILFAPVNFIPLLRFIPFFEQVVTEILETFSELDNVLEDKLKEHEKTFQPGQIRDFVDLYIKTRIQTSDAELYNASNMQRLIIDLLLAGTDTTATSVEWMILYLVAHPQVQKRCQQDIDKVIGQGRLATMEDRKDLPYVMAVITETMRISPVAPLIMHSAEVEGLLGGYTVPANCILLVDLNEIHHDPDLWLEPYVFKPERFLDKGGQFCPLKNGYFPFSSGRRMCPGEALARMEMFILFVTLLQSFTFTMGQGHEPDLQGHLGTTYSAKLQPVLATHRSV